MVNLTVDAIIAGDESKAHLYLSALGHYVSDLAVPHHTSLYFDGNSPNSRGVHVAFETLILDDLARRDSIYLDKLTGLYSSFLATEEKLNSIFDQTPTPSFGSEQELFTEVLKMIEASQAAVAVLNRAYEKANHPLGNPAHVVSLFGDNPQVQKTLFNRLTVSTQMVVAVWNFCFESAKKKAGKTDLSTTLKFDRNQAILSYPFPDYLPRRTLLEPGNVGSFRVPCANRIVHKGRVFKP
jgi:hypothetical protein